MIIDSRKFGGLVLIEYCRLVLSISRTFIHVLLKSLFANNSRYSTHDLYKSPVGLMLEV